MTGWRNRSISTIVAGAMLLVAALPARAQDGPRFSLGLLAADYHLDSDPANGSAFSLGLTAGASLTRWLDVELEATRPFGHFKREYSGPSFSFGMTSSYEDLVRHAVVQRYLYERHVDWALSGGMVLHRPRTKRWTPQFFLGVANQHAHEFRRRETIAWPEGVEQTPERLRAAQSVEESFTRDHGAITVGGGVSFAVTPRFSITPDLRLDYGSIGDEIDNAIRPSVRLIWQF